jgi:glycosyltransferase involved in cell wall biosynthesis
MRIVQFMASEGYGGAEQVFIELSNTLAEGAEVVAVLLRNATIGHRLSPLVRRLVLHSNPTSNNPFLHIELYSRLREISPDIVHTHAAKATTLVARINRLLGYPHLGTKHNDRKGRIFNHLRWVSAVSEKAARSVLAAPGAEIRVIHNGVAYEDCGQEEKDDIFTILAIGRLDRIKGFDALIEQVRSLAFPFLLCIVGEGPEKSSLDRQIRERGLAGRVVLEGFRDDIPRLMRKAHLVVISSHQEGGPKVMIESLFYADLLISTPVGAVPEVLPERFQAGQDRLAAKIAEVHAAYDRYREEFAAIAAKKRPEFSMPEIVIKYQDYYRHILAGSP